MYISSALVEDVEIRICFEPDRFPFAMGFSESPLMETFHLSMQAVHIHIKLYAVVALPSTRIQLSHISSQKCVFSCSVLLFLNGPCALVSQPAVQRDQFYLSSSKDDLFWWKLCCGSLSTLLRWGKRCRLCFNVSLMSYWSVKLKSVSIFPPFPNSQRVRVHRNYRVVTVVWYLCSLLCSSMTKSERRLIDDLHFDHWRELRPLW